MDEESIAALVADTLNYAARQCDGIPALQNIVGLDIGEVEFTDLEGKHWRLIVERIPERSGE